MQCLEHPLMFHSLTLNGMNVTSLHTYLSSHTEAFNNKNLNPTSEFSVRAAKQFRAALAFHIFFSMHSRTSIYMQIREQSQ